MALTVKIRGDATQFEKTMRGVRSAGSSVASGIGSITTAALAASAAIAGIGVAFAMSSSKKAASVESLTMQFETLLGSVTAAKKRMAELQKFAKKTPFEVSELTRASKLLETMGGSVISTGDGLRMVGDAASVAGQPIEEVALHIGRLFGALTSGTSAGESVARLQELGLMTGTAKRGFENLAASQKKGESAVLSQDEALKMLQQTFAKTEGAMDRLSATTEGKLSNMKDSIDQLQVAFGTGFNDGLKVALDSANGFLPKLEGIFTETGQIVGKAIEQSVSGNVELFARIGSIIGTAMWVGIKAVIINGLDSLGSSYWKMAGENAEKMFGKNPVDLLGKYTGIELAGKGTNLSEQLSSSIENSDLTQQLVELRKINQASQNMIKEQQNAARLLMDMQNVITPRFAN